MLKMRVIPCLDVKGGRVVKGVNFVDLVDAGDPVAQARFYDREGADELCFLDITASAEGRDTLYDVVRRTAEVCFMPLTIGGGVRTIEDVRRLLLAGADKVSINTAAVARPEFVREAAQKFGSQCIVAAIGVVELARRFEDCGVAAIIHTDIALDGMLGGIDAEAAASLARQLRIPLIASGGVAALADIAALKAHECDGIAGVICGRALYDGRIDPRAALRLAAGEPSC